jgi:NADH:ubiquinone oxidoreductase subunit 6 (subunit J)
MKHSGLLKGAFVLLLALLMIIVVTQVDWPEFEMDDDGNQTDEITNFDVAEKMFGHDDPDNPEDYEEGYAFVVLMIGLLLLVAILGGTFLAKEEKE